MRASTRPGDQHAWVATGGSAFRCRVCGRMRVGRRDSVRVRYFGGVAYTAMLSLFPGSCVGGVVDGRKGVRHAP